MVGSEDKGQQERGREGRRLRDRGTRLVAIALLGDVVSIVAGVFAAYYTRASLGPPLLAPLKHPIEIYLSCLPAVLLILLLTGHSIGLYRVRLVDIQSQVGLVLRTNGLGVLLLAGASFLSHFDYSRAMLLMFAVYCTAFQLGVRAMLSLMRERQLLREEPVRALIVGTGELAGLVAEKLARAPAPSYECSGFVAPDGAGQGDVLGTLADLPRLAHELDVEEVFVAAPDLDTDSLMHVIDACADLTTRFHVVAGPLQVLLGGGALTDLSQIPVLELPARYAPSPVYLATKRILDLTVSVVLLLLLGPAMLVIGWLLRRQTGASALFVQERVGQHGRLFRMYKFRTMRPDADPYAPAPTTPDDPRITPVGRWLRRYSLDELPQLLNVIRGDMSLVGPRPEMPFLVEAYQPWQRRRLEAKPGLTGLWQIMGRKDLPLADNIEYDFYYIRHQSFLLDLEILLRTLPVVLSGRGAY